MTLTAHLYSALVNLADSPTVTATAPPGSANWLTVAGWILWLCSGACIAGIAVAGGKLAFEGSGHGGGGGGKGVAFAIAGAIVCATAASIALGAS